MKTLSPEARAARLPHDIFVTMLNAAVTWPTKWDASDIIGKYWSQAFPDLDMTEEDCNDKLFDRIRRQLLINAGIVNPVLIETNRTKKIRKELTF